MNSSVVNINDADLNRKVINATDPVQVLVTVSIRMRQSGSYMCTVSTGVDGQDGVSTVPLSITGLMDICIEIF